MKKVEKKSLKLSINLIPTNEIFKLNQMYASTLIRDLRAESEIASGIPADMQHLYYLDKCDLVDESTVQSNDIVANAILTMDVWHVWADLVVAAANNDRAKVFAMGVTQDSDFSTPSSELLFEKEKRQWLQNRANVVLLIAAHRGHLDLCTELIQKGANVNWTTKLGRTALHLSAAQDKSSVIDLLLHKGADIDLKDANGFTPMTLANKYGHKSCERHLFMFRWQQRAKNTETKFLNPPMMAFQMFDSSLPKWKRGPAAQFYCQKLLPPGEFIGSAMNAPKRIWHRRGSAPQLSAREGETVVEESEEVKEKKKVEKMNQWLKQKSRQQKINEEIKKTKENSQRLIEEEKRRQRMNKWRESHEGEDPNIISSTGRTEFGGTSNRTEGGSKPVLNTKARMKELLLRYGLTDTEEAPKTVYENWLQQRKIIGKAVIDDNLSIYGGYLPYQQMIREFCSKKCH